MVGSVLSRLTRLHLGQLHCAGSLPGRPICDSNCGYRHTQGWRTGVGGSHMQTWQPDMTLEYSVTERGLVCNKS